MSLPPSRKLLITTDRNHTTNHNTELWSPVLTDTSTKQLLYLRLSDHCRKQDGKILSARELWELLVRLCLLEMSARIPMKSHQHDFLTMT